MQFLQCIRNLTFHSQSLGNLLTTIHQETGDKEHGVCLKDDEFLHPFA